MQPPAVPLQRTEEEHPAGVIEEQVAFGIENELGDLTYQWGIG